MSKPKDRMKEKKSGGKDKKKKDTTKLYGLGLLFVTCVRCTMFDYCVVLRCTMYERYTVHGFWSIAYGFWFLVYENVFMY